MHRYWQKQFLFDLFFFVNWILNLILKDFQQMVYLTLDTKAMNKIYVMTI